MVTFWDIFGDRINTCLEDQIQIYISVITAIVSLQSI